MKVSALLLITVFILALPINAICQEDDETALFTSVAPDALLLMDISGSMNWTPTGSKMYISTSQTCGTNVPYYPSSGTGHTKVCTIGTDAVPKYGDSACSGPFYLSSGTGHSTNCSRIAIAKRAIFSILDDNQSGTINNQDEASLGIRLGYMRFTSCSGDESGSYSSGCNKLVRTIAARYSLIFCGNSTSCTITSTGSNSVNSETASGGTPLSGAMQEAKSYLDYHKSRDNAASCRDKFVILMTDGSDTFACSGNGSEDQQDMYKRRRETVARAKALADAGYKLFVIGFGSDMPHWLRNTLNWAAYYGKTDNPLNANSGDKSAFDPSSFSSCEVSSTTHHNIEGDGDHYYSVSGDPGEIPLSGYAFLATNPSELESAIRQAINIIREAIYSFSQVSVQSTRTQDENNIYEGSFQPVNNDPFWLGHLKKFAINEDGTVGAMVWDAGERLQARDPNSRLIKTYVGGSLVDFTTANISATTLGVASDAQRDLIVGFIRGESAYNAENWKLGDVFRSTPITIGTPSAFYYDMKDSNNSFTQFRADHIRSTANGKRIILAGANDGQMHAFLTNTGDEAWSFIPPNLLTKLQTIAHNDHPTSLTHAYFVDGPVAVADVWLGTGLYTAKSASDWRTVMVLSEGRGAHDYLWSSSSGCETGFSATATYSSSYPHYCGYFALDITDTLSPSYKWRVSAGSDSAPYLGDPWSKMMIGKVLIDGQEKWVGFMGGGYNGADCSGGGACDTRGKGFFIIDLSSGAVLWSYTHGNNSELKYSMPANPAIVDSDNDGFVDTVYLGDLGGSMWRFKLCLGTDQYCNTSNWAGSRLFGSSSSSGIRPVYTSAAVARDPHWNLWIYWGTGDKTDPTAANAQEKLYAVKDVDRTTTYAIGDLDNITSDIYDAIDKPAGWYMNFSGNGEKVLSEATIFGGVIYLTSYTPSQSNDPCSMAGIGSLYALNYVSGSGILGGGARSMQLGLGIPSPPIISMKPGNAASADLYVTVSGGSGTGASTQRANVNPPGVANRTNVLFWRDKRVQ